METVCKNCRMDHISKGDYCEFCGNLILIEDDYDMDSGDTVWYRSEKNKNNNIRFALYDAEYGGDDRGCVTPDFKYDNDTGIAYIDDDGMVWLICVSDGDYTLYRMKLNGRSSTYIGKLQDFQKSDNISLYKFGEQDRYLLLAGNCLYIIRKEKRKWFIEESDKISETGHYFYHLLEAYKNNIFLIGKFSGKNIENYYIYKNGKIKNLIDTFDHNSLRELLENYYENLYYVQAPSKRVSLSWDERFPLLRDDGTIK